MSTRRTIFDTGMGSECITDCADRVVINAEEEHVMYLSLAKSEVEMIINDEDYMTFRILPDTELYKKLLKTPDAL